MSSSFKKVVSNITSLVVIVVILVNVVILVAGLVFEGVIHSIAGLVVNVDIVVLVF